MNRLRTPTEFGFSTSPYLPPEHPRPIWRTFLFGALLALIPIIGLGVSAIYIDRREVPSSFEFIAALKTALIQILALFVIALLLALILRWLGISLQFVLPFTRAGG